MIYIVIGTGVGAAIIYQGALLYGESNSAGESGHMTVDPQGTPLSLWLARLPRSLYQRAGALPPVRGGNRRRDIGRRNRCARP